MTRAFAELGGGLEGSPTETTTISCPGIGQIPVEIHYPKTPDRNDPPSPKRKMRTSLANAFRLDLYALARVLRLKQVRRGALDRLGDRPGFRSFVSDGIRGLLMVFRGKQ
jgi:hypothetical protein